MKYLFPFLLLFSFVFPACDTEEEAIPAYLYIEAVNLNAGTGEGGNTVKVTNVQAYAGTENLGIVSVPGLIPVFETGTSDFRFDPMIRDNGNSFTLALYPFYERITRSLTLTPGQTDTLRLTANYAQDRTEFLFVEQFESSNQLFTDDRDGNPGSDIVRTEVGALSGKSARLRVDTDNPRLEVATDAGNLYDLAAIPAGVYLELDFKAEVPFQLGLIGQSATIPEAVAYSYALNAKDEWTKIYLNLTSEVFASGFDAYQISVLLDLPADRTEAQVWLDNVKLVAYRN